MHNCLARSFTRRTSPLFTATLTATLTTTRSIHNTDSSRLIKSYLSKTKMSPLPESSDSIHSPFTLTKDSDLKEYLHNNRLWVEKTDEAKPGLFESNGKGQAPHTLWIGCSDSRYNENVLNVSPGEVFAFKSIANLVSIDDLTTVSTLEFSINVLKVKKVVVCGHTDCGGIWNSLSYKDLGPQNANLMKYLKKIDELRDEFIKELEPIEDMHLRAKRLAEFNVSRQLEILKRQKPVIEALAKNEIELWGLIYNVGSGLLEVVEA